MNRPTPPGPLHTGAKLGPDESTMTTQSTPTAGALRAVHILAPMLAGSTPLDPDDLALIIDRKTGTADLLTALKDIFEASRDDRTPAARLLEIMNRAGNAIAKHQGRA